MLNVLCITESTAEDLANALEERFIKTFVTDTTAVMPAMVALLGFTWIPCSAHVLNLVVKYALDYFKKSNNASFALVNAQIHYGLDQHKLLHDEPTRWNSTLTMLERNYEQKTAITSIIPTSPIVVKNKIDEKNSKITTYVT